MRDTPDAGQSQPMKTSSRRQDDVGATESPFKRINTEFGAWNTTITTSPSIMMSSTNEATDNPTSTAPPPPPPPPQAPPTAHGQAPAEAATIRPCRSFNPPMHGTPRYSKIDTFIESLDAACKALPTPLMGSASTRSPPATKDCSSTHHRHSHHCKLYHEDRRRPSNEIVKEVKFADEVIEIGEPKEMVAEAPEMWCSKRNVSDAPDLVQVIANSEARDSRVADGRFESKKKKSQFVKAATKVQSTYRGYKVRRGQPLQYLLVIGSVKAKLEELRQQFDTWKIAAWFPTDFMERVTMTENVLDLLFQLDTLQGIPVVVREYRKTVAREVIKFQEEVDGFLCHNSKHGVLFDLTRPEGNAAHKSSKAIRNRVVHESSMVENVNDSNPKAGRNGNLESLEEEVKVGAVTSSDGTSKLGSSCQSEVVTESPALSSHPNDCSEQNFVFWSPAGAQFEKVSSIVEKSSKEEQLESITDLKKCVAPTSNFDIYMTPSRKKNSYGVRFASANMGNKSFWKGYPGAAASDQCPHAPTEDTTTSNSGCYESLAKNHAHKVGSQDFTGRHKQEDDSKCAVAINKQRSLDTHANIRIHIPKDFRIANVHENLDEGCETRCPETPTKPDYPSIEKREAKFPSDIQYDNLTEIDKRCSSTEQFPPLKIEPLANKDGDLCSPAVAGCQESSEMDFRVCQTKLQAFLTDIEYVSAKDIRDGMMVPLLVNEGKDTEKKHQISAIQLEVSPKDNFRIFCADDYTESQPKASEDNWIDATQDLPHGLGTKEVLPQGAEVFTAAVEKLQELAISASEVNKCRQLTLLNSETAPELIPSESILKDSCHENADVEPESEYELCGFDDLETISSCSNCASYPADCIGTSWDSESSITEQMLHPMYALKGLVKDLDKGYSEIKVENSRNFEASCWKDELPNNYPSGKNQPCHFDIDTSEMNLAKKGESGKEDDNWKSIKMIEEKVQYFEETEKTPVEEMIPSSPGEANSLDISILTCSESNQTSLACTSQFSNVESFQSDKIASIFNESESTLILSKLVEDNKRLKELLKEVMKWNTAQASAMLTLNERLEVVESKN